MFDSEEELLRKIRLGEDSAFEFKSVHFRGGRIAGPQRDVLANELAAFANYNDGVLLLGVNDESREVEGIPLDHLDDVERYVQEICNDSIQPPLQVRIIRMELPDTLGVLKPILKVDIERSLFVHKSPGGYFQRGGSSKRELSPELLARLFQQRSQTRIIRFDEQAVPNTSFTDIEESLWKRFLPEKIYEPEVITLGKLRILCDDLDGLVRVSVSGILMCSFHPEKWLPSAIIEAVRYRGLRQDSNYQMAAQTISGPLDNQIRQALSFVRLNMTIAARKSPERQDFPQFRMRAIFEAIVNAVAHRDYSIYGSKIRLFMFDDRLELYSPGTLPNTLTIESLPLRQCIRNELITSLLARCAVTENESYSGRRALMDKRGGEYRS